jgi:4-amino-4-deoxy-L-arabinose transferase-like glycosyltransferase
VPTLLFVAAGGLTLYALWVGVDFGSHFDERVQYDLVIRSYQNRLLLPRWYGYPSMIYWLDLASVADKISAIFWAGGIKPQIPFDFRFFILRARELVILVSLLGGVWIFLSLRVANLARPALAAALGGSIYVLSWEFGYHARWLATDLVVSQFAALFVFCLAKAETAENPRSWLTSAAVAAGLATATKYTAGGLVPALWVYVVSREGCSRRAMLTTVARGTAVAMGVYLAITPGTLLDPIRFAQDVFVEWKDYANGHGIFHGVSPYDIHNHWLYLVRLWEYFTLALLSPQPAIATVLLVVSIFGVIASWRRSRPLAAALGFLMIFYSIFFSLHIVFIVRNFLILLPVFAYLGGVGFDALIERELNIPLGWPRQLAVLATGVLLAIAFAWNAWQQIASGLSIADAHRQPLARQVAEFLTQQASMPTALSSRLASDLVAIGAPLPANVTEPSRAVRYIFLASEIASTDANLAFWPATRHDTFEWIGPREVNLNYYPTWGGADHAIILNINTAEHMGVVEPLYRGQNSPDVRREPLD